MKNIMLIILCSFLFLGCAQKTPELQNTQTQSNTTGVVVSAVSLGMTGGSVGGSISEVMH